MKNSIGIYKRIVSLIVLTVMVLGLVPSVSAAEAKTVDEIISQSVVLEVKTPYYLKNGKQFNYSDNQYYYPQLVNNELMVPLRMLNSVLDFQYSYNSKKEEAVITKGNKKITVRANTDGIYIEGSDAKYIKNLAVNTGRELLLPFDSVAQALGYTVFKLNFNAVTVATYAKEADFTGEVKSKIASLMVNSEEIIFQENFEEPKWTMSSWGGSGEYLISTECGKGSNDFSAYMGATQKSSYGLMSSRIDYDHAKEYRLVLDAKVTDDWANTTFKPAMWTYNSEGTFIAGQNFIEFDDLEPTTEWQTFTYVMPKFYFYDDKFVDFAKFQINLQLTCAKANEASGGIFIDNVRLLENTSPTADVDCDFEADKFAAWYYPGETVKYTCKNPDALRGYNSIKIKVTDSNFNVIHTDSRSVDEIITKGWSYTPEELGYYEVEFSAVSPDGTVRKIVKGYIKLLKRDEGTPLYAFLSQPTVHFAVVKGAAKPMELRNDMHMASAIPYQESETEFRLLDMLGVAGLRLHYILWGNSYAGHGGIEDTPDVYNFTKADKWVQYSDQFGFKNIMANFFSTPIWAVEEKWRDPSNITTFGYVYQKMAPENMEDLAEAIQEFYKHYKGKVDILEFMNEPAYGNTAFWADTPEKLAEMIKTAYKALREVDPNKNMLMAAASWNQGYKLYAELLSKDKDFYDSFDMFTFHSRYAGDLKYYEDANNKYGYESKPAAATEEYLYSAYRSGKPKDHNVSTMHYYACYFNHIKKNVEYVTMFEVQDNVPDELRCAQYANGITPNHTIGLFTAFPYVEPHKGAVAAFNLYENIGLDFTYAGEFDFGNGQKAVYFMNDGEPVVYVWNSDDKPFYLSDELKNALTDKVECQDFMGKDFNIDDEMQPLTMYYIKGFDKNKIDAIEKNEGHVLNDDFEREYYTCKLPEFIPVDDVVLDETFEGIVIDNAETAPFDKETFKLNDNIEWITDNWNWVTQNHEKPAGFDSKFAAYVDNDGMYLVVDVTDSTINQQSVGSEWPSLTWQNDSIQLAFDCYGTGDSAMRAEFQIGMFKDKPLMYKEKAPEISFVMVDGWSDSKSELDTDKYLRIEKTNKGLMYKVFIPMSEMYPFQYSSTTDHLRFSLLVNDNNGTGRSYYEWSSGIGGTKDPKAFGALKFNNK